MLDLSRAAPLFVGQVANLRYRNWCCPTKKLLAGIIALILLVSRGVGQEPRRVIVDFADRGIKEKISTVATSARLVTTAGQVLLEATYQVDKNPWPHVAIHGPWDLSEYTGIEVDITNSSDSSFKIACRVDNPGANGTRNNSGGDVAIIPGETTTLKVEFNRDLHPQLREKLAGMDWYPDLTRDGPTLDPSNIVKIQFFMQNPPRERVLRIGSIRAVGRVAPEQPKGQPMDNFPVSEAQERDRSVARSVESASHPSFGPEKLPEPFFPFIDEYGQYLHRDWPRKTYRDEDLIVERKAEDLDLASSPGPDDWDPYGGWASGPALEATGHFRVARHHGKWWFVDPEGRLFWSYGIDCVGKFDAATFVEGDREAWFKELPRADSPLEKYYTTAKGGSLGDFKGQTLQAFRFIGANLERKYGDNWQPLVRDRTLRRLQSWGVNTLGCWSSDEMAREKKRPYATWIFYRSKRIYDWSLLRKPFPDVYDPQWEENLKRRALGTTRRSADDPWCIGYFVDNELPWGDKTTIAAAALRSIDEDQYIKLAFLADLKEKYDNDIERLNSAWNAGFASWNDVGRRQGEKPAFLPRTEQGTKDLEEFTEKTVHRYFRVVRTVVKSAAPNKLYLGCRFSQFNPQVVRIANRYVDVLSFNMYRDTVGQWNPPVRVDKPVLIGEFHFGAQDRGPFGPGLVEVDSQQERGESLEEYLTAAMKHPLFVGAHWFQLYDEPTSGRTLDGENHQIGFVDICDTPYPRTIAASRNVGYRMYEIRSQSAATIEQQDPSSPLK